MNKFINNHSSFMICMFVYAAFWGLSCFIIDKNYAFLAFICCLMFAIYDSYLKD